ncbi:hypothetical protein Tco_0247622, partial [Tanacetum coccineum]
KRKSKRQLCLLIQMPVVLKIQGLARRKEGHRGKTGINYYTNEIYVIHTVLSQNPKQMVQEDALATLALVADSSRKSPTKVCRHSRGRIGMDLENSEGKWKVTVEYTKSELTSTKYEVVEEIESGVEAKSNVVKAPPQKNVLAEAYQIAKATAAKGGTNTHGLIHVKGLEFCKSENQVLRKQASLPMKNDNLYEETAQCLLMYGDKIHAMAVIGGVLVHWMQGAMCNEHFEKNGKGASASKKGARDGVTHNV